MSYSCNIVTRVRDIYTISRYCTIRIITINWWRRVSSQAHAICSVFNFRKSTWWQFL